MSTYVTLLQTEMVRDLVESIVTNWGSEDSLLLVIANRLVEEKREALRAARLG